MFTAEAKIRLTPHPLWNHLYRHHDNTLLDLEALNTIPGLPAQMLQ